MRIIRSFLRLSAILTLMSYFFFALIDSKNAAIISLILSASFFGILILLKLYQFYLAGKLLEERTEEDF